MGQQCGKPAADRSASCMIFSGRRFKTEMTNRRPASSASASYVKGLQCDRISWIRCQGKYAEQQLVRMQPLSQVGRTDGGGERRRQQPTDSDAALTLSENLAAAGSPRSRTDRRGGAVFSRVEIDFNAVRRTAALSDAAGR